MNFNIQDTAQVTLLLFYLIFAVIALTIAIFILIHKIDKKNSQQSKKNRG